MKKFWDSSSYLNSEPEMESERISRAENEMQGEGVLPKILSFAAIFIVIAIIFVTAAAFASNKAHFASGLRRADPSPAAKSRYASYTELGEMRLQTADENSVLVLEPWFPYQAGDTDFLEEINQKSRAIKITIASYFKSRTKKQLLDSGENAVKKELLDEINSQLIAGKFGAIYFSEYLFLN